MRTAVPVPNFVDRCAIPWTRIQYRQPPPQRSRPKTPAMSIAGKAARGASDEQRSSIGTVEAARRRLHNTPLERGRGRSSARTRQACRFPRTARTGPKVRDWPLNRGTISPNEETGLPLNDETRFPLRGDWRADFTPATWRKYVTSSPGTVLSQQTRGDVQADLQQLDAFQRGTVADMLREMLEGAVPEHGAAS